MNKCTVGCSLEQLDASGSECFNRLGVMQVGRAHARGYCSGPGVLLF